MSSERTFPFYENRQIFSTDENILKKQLKESEIMQLFKERRAEQTKHPHRPRYHFTSPIGIINDPNGLCFWNDSWHLFYQLMLNDTVYWGHAKSSDLINWEDLPPAIYPDNTFQCWSGGTCVDGDRVIAMYYGFPKGIMISTSTDPLLVNWTRLQQEPVIKIADIPKFPQDGSTIPDPFLWKEGNTYYALIGGI